MRNYVKLLGVTVLLVCALLGAGCGGGQADKFAGTWTAMKVDQNEVKAFLKGSSVSNRMPYLEELTLQKNGEQKNYLVQLKVDGYALKVSNNPGNQDSIAAEFQSKVVLNQEVFRMEQDGSLTGMIAGKPATITFIEASKTLSLNGTNYTAAKGEAYDKARAQLRNQVKAHCETFYREHRQKRTLTGVTFSDEPQAAEGQTKK